MMEDSDWFPGHRLKDTGVRIRGGVDTGAGKKQRSVKLQEVENRKQETVK